MSLERAAIHCERCYSFVSKYIEKVEESFPDVSANEKASKIYSSLISDNNVYVAKNMAMIALEELLHLKQDGESAIKATVAKGALDFCFKCDYTQPKISRTVKSNLEFIS